MYDGRWGVERTQFDRLNQWGAAKTQQKQDDARTEIEKACRAGASALKAQMPDLTVNVDVETLTALWVNYIMANLP